MIDTDATVDRSAPATERGREVTLAERLAALNEAQLAAVDCVEGPLLCLAGAGSGKTRVLTTRIANLVSAHGVEPDEILALTFTRKAAEEMRDRLADVLGTEAADRLTLGTFHSVGVQILREYGSLLGLSSKFGIADDGDVLTRVRRVLRKHDIPRGDPDYRASDVADRFAKAKMILSIALAHNDDVDPDVGRVGIYRAGDLDIFTSAANQGDLDEFDVPLFTKLFADYQALLVGDDVLDFQDLISLPLLLFRDRPDVLAIFQNRWRHISVDEYQDTDDVQELFISALAAKHRNLMVVGDDDQSIYGFRDAKIENIRTFEHRWAPCTVVKLEENYRSTPNILAVANAVIAAQEDRPYDKILRPNLPEGPSVRLWSSSSQEAEAEAVVGEAIRLLEGGEVRSLDEVMVLYRVNSIAEAIERALRRAQVAYRLVGGTRFQDRKEVRDLMGYLKLAANWSDTASFERIVNEPSRGIGVATMETIMQEARVRGLDPVTVALDAESYTGLRPQQKRALVEFGQIVAQISEADREGGAVLAIHRTLELTGYRETLIDRLADAEENDDEEEVCEARNRLHVIGELVHFVEEHDRATRLSTRRPARIHDVVLALTAAVPSDGPAAENLAAGASRYPGTLSLMSIHASKGLEAPVVFVIGLEDGILPVTPRPGEIDTSVDVEEEGRLFYVAITRAQRRLILSTARTREVRGDLPRSMPRSRFLARLPETGYVIENRS